MTNISSHLALALSVWFAFTAIGCIGREAGSSVTVTSATEAAADEPTAPANDADYPDIVDTKAPAGNAIVTVSLDARFQTLEGFGAALAWYEDRITGATPKGVYDLLFPDLGLDIIRFRNRYHRKDQTENHPEWSAEIVKRANQALGRPLKVLLSGWSPPAASEGQSKGKMQEQQ